MNRAPLQRKQKKRTKTIPWLYISIPHLVTRKNGYVETKKKGSEEEKNTVLYIVYRQHQTSNFECGISRRSWESEAQKYKEKVELYSTHTTWPNLVNIFFSWLQQTEKNSQGKKFSEHNVNFINTRSLRNKTTDLEK